jgi:hypothetical protein
VKPLTINPQNRLVGNRTACVILMGRFTLSLSASTSLFALLSINSVAQKDQQMAIVSIQTHSKITPAVGLTGRIDGAS